MSAILLGDIRNFAVEYEISQMTSHLWGKCRFWIEGEYLGNFADINILSVTSEMLKHLIRSREMSEFEMLKKRTPNSIMPFIMKSDKLNDDCLYCFGEGFDDFSYRAFKFQSKFWFVWNLPDAPNSKHPGYSQGTRMGSVDEEVVLKVANHFIEVIDSYRKNEPTSQP